MHLNTLLEKFESKYSKEEIENLNYLKWEVDGNYSRYRRFRANYAPRSAIRKKRFLPVLIAAAVVVGTIIFGGYFLYDHNIRIKTMERVSNSSVERDELFMNFGKEAVKRIFLNESLENKFNEAQNVHRSKSNELVQEVKQIKDVVYEKLPLVEAIKATAWQNILAMNKLSFIVNGHLNGVFLNVVNSDVFFNLTNTINENLKNSTFHLPKLTIEDMNSIVRTSIQFKNDTVILIFHVPLLSGKRYNLQQLVPVPIPSRQPGQFKQVAFDEIIMFVRDTNDIIPGSTYVSPNYCKHTSNLTICLTEELSTFRTSEYEICVENWLVQNTGMYCVFDFHPVSNTVCFLTQTDISFGIVNMTKILKEVCDIEVGKQNLQKFLCEDRNKSFKTKKILQNHEKNVHKG